MTLDPSYFTAESLQAIEEAIATGASIVTYSTSAGGSKSVTYRSLNDMLRIRDIIKKALGLSCDVKSVHPAFSKGL